MYKKISKRTAGSSEHSDTCEWIRGCFLYASGNNFLACIL